jgi:hypothetical protein
MGGKNQEAVAMYQKSIMLFPGNEEDKKALQKTPGPEALIVEEDGKTLIHIGNKRGVCTFIYKCDHIRKKDEIYCNHLPYLKLP